MLFIIILNYRNIYKINLYKKYNLKISFFNGYRKEYKRQQL